MGKDDELRLAQGTAGELRFEIGRQLPLEAEAELALELDHAAKGSEPSEVLRRRLWGSLWGSPTPKRADFGGLDRMTPRNDKEPKALD